LVANGNSFWIDEMSSSKIFALLVVSNVFVRKRCGMLPQLILDGRLRHKQILHIQKELLVSHGGVCLKACCVSLVDDNCCCDAAEGSVSAESRFCKLVVTTAA